MEGSLFTGLKEGAYYVSQEGYRKQFLDKLGFDPYFGTLNLKLTSIENRLKLDTLPYIRIEGFESEGRTFGPARCYEAIVNDTEKGAVIVALRSHYDPSVIEVISPIYLRDRFKLKDGDIVKVKIPISKGR
jgi:riboflavin kinase